MSSPASDALAETRKAIAKSMVRTRSHLDALEDIERLVARLELACIRQVAQARENGHADGCREERERCARIVSNHVGSIGDYALGLIRDGDPCR